MSGLQKESRTDPVAGSSSMIEPSMMVQSEGYFNTVQPTAAWTGTSACSQLCRMCATENEYLIPIFEGEGVEHQLGMKIDKHLPIRVHVGDTLPLHVCYQCASTLIAWHDLVVGCIEAEKKLLQIQTHGRAEAQVEEVDVKSADNALFFPEQMDTDGGAEPSTSGATNVPTRGSPKKTVPKANPKLKMVIVKTPTAPAAAASSRIVAPKTEAIPDTAERSPTSPPPTTTTTASTSVPFDALQPAARRRTRTAFTCGECGDTFSLKSRLDKHLADHDATTTTKEAARSPPRKRPATTASYACDECGRQFALKDSYSRHRRIHSDERPFTCHVCGKQFRDSGGLARHFKDVHVGVKAFACELCDRAFASKATRDDHRRTHTGERPYVCAACGKAFKSKASLYTHAKVHTDVFPHACPECDKRFRRRQELLAHASTHTGDKPHACDVCAKCFRVRGELLRHRLVHSDAKPFVCVVCSLGFRQKRYLRNHQKSRHAGVDADLDPAFDQRPAGTRLSSPGVRTLPAFGSPCPARSKAESSRSKPSPAGDVPAASSSASLAKPTARLVKANHGGLQCSACDRRFASKRDLEEHFRPDAPSTCSPRSVTTTASPGRHRCPVCRRQLASRAKLSEHARTHTGERPLTCHVCGAHFASRTGVLRHVRAVHDATRDFVCDACGKAYKCKRDLVDHRRAHTGETPFACAACGKAFAVASTLLLHQRTHSAARPHACALCVRAFKRAGHLAVHVRRAHTGEKAHACANLACGKRFASAWEARKHARAVHKVEGVA